MPPPRGSLTEVSAAFLKLGLLSFGGPVAHIGYFHAEFVRKRRWIDDDAYGDLVALCQFLPGPASSQVVFALGLRRAGLPGALAASACFLFPSVAIMIAFALGVAAIGDLRAAGWLGGLRIAAVAVVAQAVWLMAHRLCTDAPRIAIAFLAAAVSLALPSAWTQVGAIAAGAILSCCFGRSTLAAPPFDDHPPPTSRRAALVALALFVTLLVAMPILAHAIGARDLAVFDSFYRAGSLVFGGGHVVLPLLRAEVVPHGWVSDDAFLAGYGAAQALPGPLFSFAAYLGAMIYAGPRAVLGGVLCVLTIFLPAWLLIYGTLPFWHTLRSRAWARSALRGASAAVVGVLLAALVTPLCTEAIHTPGAAVAALAALALLALRIPAIIVVALCAAAGQWLLAAR